MVGLMAHPCIRTESQVAMDTYGYGYHTRRDAYTQNGGKHNNNWNNPAT